MSSPPSGTAARPLIALDAQILKPAASGLERAIISLIVQLPKVAPQYRYAVYGSRKRLPREIRESGVEVRPTFAPVSLRALRILWQQTALSGQLRRDGVSLLHAPAYTSPLRTRIPVVLTIYDLIALKFPQYCKRESVLHCRLMIPAAARRARRIIVPSEATRHDVIRMLGISEEKVRVVPLGVDARFTPVDDPAELTRVRNELELPQNYILYVGNLEPKKNLPALIEAFAELRRSGRVSHRLVIAGRKAWRYAPIFAKVKALRVEDSVQFLGRVPEESLRGLYAGASAFVFPSLYEGFGLPVLEAMACGTPVLTSNAGAIPEVAGDAALMVDPADVRQMRAALEKMLSNSFLAMRLRELGLARAKLFTWEKTAAATAAVYAEALEAEDKQE